MADLVYMDDLLTVAQAISAPVFDAPFSSLAVNTQYVLTQNFRQLKANKADLALSTPHPDYATFILVAEGPEQDVEANVVEWMRTYAKVPANFSRIEGTTNYTFPAFLTGVTETSRPPITLSAQARVLREFLLTTDPRTDLPPIPQQRYVLQPTPQYDASDANGQTPAVANNIPGATILTIPSLTTYLAWVAAPQTNEIVAFVSSVDIWMGNIYLRKTVYIEPR